MQEEKVAKVGDLVDHVSCRRGAGYEADLSKILTLSKYLAIFSQHKAPNDT